MSINTQKSRERIKRSTLTGVVPTVPVSADFTDGTWLNTDIRAGEFFYNIPDEKLWIGTNTVPLELTSGIGNTLAQILLNGNTTGGSDIEMSLGDSIISPDISGVRNSALNLGQIDTTVSYTDTALTMFSKSIYETGRIRNIVNDASNSTPVVGDIYAMVDILNNPGVQTTVGLIANNLVNNSFANLVIDADIMNPTIYQSTINNTLYSYLSQHPSQIKLTISDNNTAIPNPATDIFAQIDTYIVGTNKPNILIQTNVPGNFNQRIDIAHTGMVIASDIGLTISSFSVEINTTSFFDIMGMYNGLSATIFRTDDNFAIPITSTSNQTPGIIIGSQNSTIAAGVYNSLIIGGNNNQILVGNGNIISGANNSNNTGSGNFITGINNINNGSSSIIFGTNNTNNDDYNIIGGFTNTNTAGNNNILSGTNNINTLGDYNFISGDTNTNTSGSGNIISGTNNTNTSGNYNFISGGGNTNTNGSGNILSGQGNEILNNVQNSLLVGSNNIMFNPGIMYGNGGVDVISNGFSNAYNHTGNATPTLLTIDGTNSFKIDLSVTYRVELTLLVKNVNTGDAKEWKGFGIIKNVAGTTSLVGGTLTMTSTIGDVSLATATVAVTANNTTDCLDITVTGIAATNLIWNCGIEYVLINV